MEHCELMLVKTDHNNYSKRQHKRDHMDKILKEQHAVEHPDHDHYHPVHKGSRYRQTEKQKEDLAEYLKKPVPNKPIMS